jgi:hypothetical protein
LPGRKKPVSMIVPAGSANQNASPLRNGNAMSPAPIFSGIR